MQFADLIVHLYDLRRLDKGCLARGRLVMDKTRKRLFPGRIDRDEHLPVADRDPRVGVDNPVLLGLPKDGVDAFRDVQFLLPDTPADIEKGIGGRVLDFSVLVEDSVDAADDFRERENAVSRLFQAGIDPVLDPPEEMEDLPLGIEEGPEFAEGELVDRRILPDCFQEADTVDISARREVLFKHQDQPHLVGRGEPLLDLFRLAGEFFRRHPFRCVIRRTTVGNSRPYPAESQFLL